MKTLIVYFSAERGTTAAVAREAAEALGADLLEIRPEKPYTPGDLRYANPLARCNREFFGKKNVPAANRIENLADYETVLIGFPIWYGCAPLAVSSFCREHDWTGKRIAAFATSGGSGIGKTAEKLAPSLKGAASLDAKLVHDASEL